jgi:hypothetical protein
MAEDAFVEWAGREFGSCSLGDWRRTKRLVKIAAGLAENVGGAVSSCCGRIGAQLISRFFDQDEVSVDSVLQSHVAATAKRCVESGLVIAVQDTTFLDFTGRKDLEDELGPIGPCSESRGVLMHSVLGVSPGRSVFGLLGMDVWTRDPADYGSGAKRRKRLIADKESRKWLDGLAKAESALPESQPLLLVGDRESDVFALFAAPRRATTDLLVRANQNRALVDSEYSRMRDAIEAAEVLGSYKVSIPRQGSRRAREAHLEIQARAIVVKAPLHRTPDVADVPVTLSVVRAREIDAPDGVEPLEWILLTSMVVNDLADARRIIDFYGVRWVIEEFHRVLKSGCRVESVQFETLDRLKPVIAVLSVVAWRVLSLCKNVREEPDAPASCVCSETERVVMEKWMALKKEKAPRIRTASEFVRAVAILGGFMARKCDGKPGTKTLWQGLRRLEDLVKGYELATSMGL